MQEWKLLLRGVLNNAPEIADEWQTPSRNEVRKILRQAYGKDGDERRRRRYSAIVVGPRTNEIVVRFMIKLSKALYFRHNRHVFDGVLYTYQIDKMRADTTPEYLKEVYRMATGLPALSRNNKSLYDQFIYRFNHSAADKVAYAVVEFGVQWVFQLMAIPREMDEQLISREEAAAGMLNFRHECFLEAAKRNQDLNSRLDRREIS